MAIDPPLPDPELDRIGALIAHCEKRADRARVKLSGAQREAEAAEAALTSATTKRAQYIADHPDPQCSLPL